MSSQTERDEYRAVAIRCVAELARGVQTLDVEVCGRAGQKNVRTTINEMRGVLKVLQDAVARDGRWAHWTEAS